MTWVILYRSVHNGIYVIRDNLEKSTFFSSSILIFIPGKNFHKVSQVWQVMKYTGMRKILFQICDVIRNKHVSYNSSPSIGVRFCLFTVSIIFAAFFWQLFKVVPANSWFIMSKTVKQREESNNASTLFPYRLVKFIRHELWGKHALLLTRPFAGSRVITGWTIHGAKHR